MLDIKPDALAAVAVEIARMLDTKHDAVAVIAAEREAKELAEEGGNPRNQSCYIISLQ